VTAAVHATICTRMSPERRELPNVSDARAVANQIAHRDPYWGPQLVVAAALLLDFSLPERLTIGPSWLMPAFEGLLLAGLVAISPHPRLRNSPLRRRVAMGLIGVVSVVNVISLVLLCHYLLKGGGLTHAHALVLGGIVLWVTNVLLFGLWYWELDRGGPVARDEASDVHPDFLFPQMIDSRFAPEDWTPNLIDYLYVSFTNATAFSPTDTMPLTRWAKLLMTAQSATALATLGLVVARAVNILPT
jgi:uncharacterized membrane protein